METPAARKRRKKTMTATLTTVPVELENLTDTSTRIELKNADGRPMGRFLFARTSMEFRGPSKKSKGGVRKTWEQVIAWFGEE